MMHRVIGLLFFAFVLLGPVAAEDYKLLKGDTLSSVGQRKKIPAEVLQRANPELDADRLKPGDTLAIPERYTVKAGDTLYSLCRQWGVDQAALGAFNRWPANFTLKKGQVVFVPPKAKPSAGTGAFWPVEKTPRAEGDKLKSVTFATAGEPFRSVTSGTVVYKGEFRGVGRVLLVQGADKTVFGYGNYEDSPVEFGQTVEKGQVLGTTSPRASQKLSFFAFLQSDPLDVFTAKR